MVVAFDAKGRYYTLGGNGLLVFDQPNGVMIDSLSIKSQPNNLIPDKNGNMWICSSDGLLQYRPGRGIIKQYDSKGRTRLLDAAPPEKRIPGLLSNVVYEQKSQTRP